MAEEVITRNITCDLLEETRTSMEDIVTKMLFSKKDGRPTSHLRELVTQISLHFINLRQVNRTIPLEEDSAKSETKSAKARLDFVTLPLQSLMYEKNHYMKAIEICRDFKTKHPDISVVDEEEFYRSAPDEIKGIRPNGYARDLMLRRLDFEFFQRKSLCKEREELEHRKKSLQEVIASRKKFRTSLPSHLKSLKKAWMPVQQQLGISHTMKLKHHSAELFPAPLYVLFSQLMSQKETFGDNIELEIVGSMKDAHAVARLQANKHTGNNGNMEYITLKEDAVEEEETEKKKETQKGSYEGRPGLRYWIAHGSCASCF